ncbi:MAG TPA: epoxyqueuosine reductase QueH [Bacillota bacterium]|nr:epoxyqueuosine reductase QueH [Bacillota bacterium]HPT87684.1 epoxyqueuosine reductase QueH [Bacillota bacterium]
MSLLLHTCCGPCAAYTTSYLLEKGHEPTLYFYNPNIHPYQEYQRRLEGLQQLAAIRNLPVVVEPGYPLEEFLREIALDPEFGKRCVRCYRIRLEKTAEKAKELGMTAFSTTLLISPYQNREQICAIGQELAGQYGLTFIDEDFRSGFRQSQAMAKEYGLYRQGYCGCIYSEKDRYYKSK